MLAIAVALIASKSNVNPAPLSMPPLLTLWPWLLNLLESDGLLCLSPELLEALDTNQSKQIHFCTPSLYFVMSRMETSIGRVTQGNFYRQLGGNQWETFWDDRGQQTYRVNPLFSELCVCSELRKQWKFTRYVCCRLALESLLLHYVLENWA